MISWTGPSIRNRHDRHVRRARLSISAGASLHRLAFTVEEALRLASLPGEDQGRSYYFRLLKVTGLPPDGDRGAWLDKFQRALSSEAMQAVHAADARARTAPAVFFRSEQEALEILLHRILARRPLPEWFWPMVITGGDTSRGACIPPKIIDIVERLRAHPASWVAVAVALFAVPGFDVGCLIEAIPATLLQSWLREMESPRPIPASVTTDISRLAQPALQKALRLFGFEDARTVWLATLAVLLDSPSELAAGAAVWRARTALQRLVSEHKVSEAGRSVEVAATTSGPASNLARLPATAPFVSVEPAPTATHSRLTDSARLPASASLESNSAAPSDSADAPATPALRDGFEVPDAVSWHHASPSAAGPASPSIESGRRPAPIPWYCVGRPTTAAGLFFLLNALQRIGISQALAAGLNRIVPDLVPRLLQRLAVRAGVTQDDPTLLWLDSLLVDATIEDAFPVDASWWPSNLLPSRATATRDDLIRAWSIAVRRWCWRSGRLSVLDIVSRAGVFSVNRTDLDVSLPLDAADVRVRRVGLDLDPGWLPWFGRVVRFHYLHCGEFKHG